MKLDRKGTDMTKYERIPVAKSHFNNVLCYFKFYLILKIRAQ